MALPALAARPGANADGLASAFNREMETTFEDGAIELDDVHLIEQARKSFPSSGRRRPAGLNRRTSLSPHVVCAIRMVSLAARDEVAGLNEERPRFTVGEGKALVQVRNTAESADADAETLVSSTQGRLTGRLLLAELMSRGARPGRLPLRSGNRPRCDCLAGEVFAQ